MVIIVKGGEIIIASDSAHFFLNRDLNPKFYWVEFGAKMKQLKNFEPRNFLSKGNDEFTGITVNYSYYS